MRQTAWIAAILSIALVASVIVHPTTASASVAYKQYSSQQIFEGLFYGEGPVAGLFPQMWNKDTRAALGIAKLTGTPKFIAGIHQVEHRISKVDPTYFSEVGSQFTSGDPGLVSQALDRTTRDLKRIGGSFSGAGKSVAENVNININVNANYTYAVFVLAIVAYGLAVVVAAAVFLLEDHQVHHVTAYSRDQAVAQIATVLSS